MATPNVNSNDPKKKIYTRKVTFLSTEKVVEMNRLYKYEILLIQWKFVLIRLHAEWDDITKSRSVQFNIYILKEKNTKEKYHIITRWTLGAPESLLVLI